MVLIHVHHDGKTVRAERVDPAWLEEGSGVTVWVDLVDPTADELRILSDPFQFHELAIEDAATESHYPKVESYDGYLYLILHGIDFEASKKTFSTHDVDFFIGASYLVTSHDSLSRSFPEVANACLRNPRLMGEGPMAMVHRLVDTMVDHYRPEVEKLDDRLDDIENAIFSARDGRVLTRRILEVKREVAALRRIILPQRDVLGRLARGEFPQISAELAYRFRDVHDHVVRLADEAMIFQDRITAVLEANLSNVSNRLNEIMKVLTVLSTIFLPLSVVAGVYGMNVRIPFLPGGEGAQFWWILAIMAAVAGGMLWWFRRRKWL